MAKYTPEELAEKIRRRAEKIRAGVPRSFKAGARKAGVLSRDQLRQDVYSSGGAHSKSGTLLRQERLVQEGDNVAYLTNRAKTSNGTYYGWLIHEGIPALSAPTMSGGKPAYVWLTDPLKPRPRSKEGWRAASREGIVVRAQRIRARKRRPWRTEAMPAMMNAIRQGLQAEMKRALQ